MACAACAACAAARAAASAASTTGAASAPRAAPRRARACAAASRGRRAGGAARGGGADDDARSRPRARKSRGGGGGGGASVVAPRASNATGYEVVADFGLSPTEGFGADADGEAPGASATGVSSSDGDGDGEDPAAPPRARRRGRPRRRAGAEVDASAGAGAGASASAGASEDAGEDAGAARDLETVEAISAAEAEAEADAAEMLDVERARLDDLLAGRSGERASEGSYDRPSSAKASATQILSLMELSAPGGSAGRRRRAVRRSAGTAAAARGGSAAPQAQRSSYKPVVAASSLQAGSKRGKALAQAPRERRARARRLGVGGARTRGRTSQGDGAESDGVAPIERRTRTSFGEGNMLSGLVESLSDVPLLTAADELEFAKSARQYVLISRERRSMQRELGRQPSVAELAAQLGYESPDVLRRAAREGKAARLCMVEANMRLVLSIAGRYKKMGLPITELVHAGTVGLIYGIDKFQWDKGYRLSTYVTWWIRQGISRAIANQSRTVRLPSHVYEQVARIKKARAELMREGDVNSGDPPVEAIAKRVGMSVQKVEDLLRASRDLVSLDQTLETANNSSGTPMSSNALADELLLQATGGEGLGVEDLDDDGEARHPISEDIRLALKDILLLLEPRERNVLRMRYGLDSHDGRSLSLVEISAAYGVTRERIRQIELKALRKLRNPKAQKMLVSYMAPVSTKQSTVAQEQQERVEGPGLGQRPTPARPAEPGEAEGAEWLANEMLKAAEKTRTPSKLEDAPAPGREGQ